MDVCKRALETKNKGVAEVDKTPEGCGNETYYRWMPKTKNFEGLRSKKISYSQRLKQDLA
jgi:hypothetical protein